MLSMLSGQDGSLHPICSLLLTPFSGLPRFEKCLHPPAAHRGDLTYAYSTYAIITIGTQPRVFRADQPSSQQTSPAQPCPA